jgi:hypothetical protein
VAATDRGYLRAQPVSNRGSWLLEVGGMFGRFVPYCSGDCLLP